MPAFGDHRWNAAILLALVLLVAIGALLSQKPQMAWNAGSRERLSDALRMIGRELWEGKVSPQDFMPRSIDDGGDRFRDAEVLAEKHGVLCKWHRDGRFEEIVFYPMAISRQIVIQPHSNAKARPQIVMVPVDLSDRESLPNLHGCTNATVKETWDCQMRGIRQRLSKHGITHAATLMSDGTIVFIEVDEFAHSRDMGRSAKDGE